MKNDPIIEEIQKIRREYASRFDNNLHSICEDARQKQNQKGRNVIAANPKPILNDRLGRHAA